MSDGHLKLNVTRTDLILPPTTICIFVDEQSCSPCNPSYLSWCQYCPLVCWAKNLEVILDFPLSHPHSVHEQLLLALSSKYIHIQPLITSTVQSLKKVEIIARFEFGYISEQNKDPCSSESYIQLQETDNKQYIK